MLSWDPVFTVCFPGAIRSSDPPPISYATAYMCSQHRTVSERSSYLLKTLLVAFSCNVAFRFLALPLMIFNDRTYNNTFMGRYFEKKCVEKVIADRLYVRTMPSSILETLYV